MSQKNDEKIMNLLIKNKDKEFKVTEIAEKTQIDIKNMGRYLKSLEEKQQIKIRPVQEGKVRTKFISFAQPSKSEIQADPAGPAAAPKSEEPAPPVTIDEPLPLMGAESKQIHEHLKTIKPAQISLEKVLKKIEAFPQDNREFQNIIRRVQIQHRKSYIDEVVNLVNQFFDELI